MNAGLLITIIAALSAGALDTGQLHSLLTEGNALFRQANELAATDPDGAKDLYQKSILRFERILEEGGVCNGQLYYNLGNAYFMSGDLGRAILNYRRAEQYLPNDPNVLHNLSYVRSQRLDRVDEPQRARVLKTLFFWHYDFSARARTILFVPFFLALWILAGLRLFVRRALITWGIVICAIVSGLLFGSLMVEAVQHSRDVSGVITAQEIAARKGNGETYQPSFEEPLHSGTEFILEEDRGGWYYIRLRDNRTCWIPQTAAEMVHKP
ncbi:MAG TPA: tetratricopeptide repeat protein [Candidatus Hydrogenedentes bacterium]|nr:tetratricopeptide repeat protein [Candidatus Hydrogenedentota bacterium]